jgi:predicted membrane protein
MVSKCKLVGFWIIGLLLLALSILLIFYGVSVNKFSILAILLGIISMTTGSYFLIKFNNGLEQNELEKINGGIENGCEL